MIILIIIIVIIIRSLKTQLPYWVYLQVRSIVWCIVCVLLKYSSNKMK